MEWDNFHSAIAYFDLAIELKRGYANIGFEHTGRALALIELAYYQESIIDCNTAIEYLPKFPVPYFLKARALYHLLRLSEAKRVVQQGLKLS